MRELVSRLLPYWETRGALREARRWIDVATNNGPQTATSWLARARMSAGYLSLLAGDPQRGVADMEAGREILLEVGEDDYWSLSGLAMAEAEVGHRIRAAELWRQAAEVAKQDGNLSRQATCAGNLAGNAVEMGEYD